MKTGRLLSISLGHMFSDILSSSVAMILTMMSGQFELEPSGIAFGALLYTICSSLTQPFFGLWADKLRGRWLAPAGLLWTMLFFLTIPFAPSYFVMITLLCIGALGSAAIHTAGMLIAPDAGGRYSTTATSIFFVLGQLGLAVGPFFAGTMFERFGMMGLLIPALTALPIVVLMFIALRDPIDDPNYEPLNEERIDEKLEERETNRVNPKAAASTQVAWGALGALLLLILLRSTTLHSYTVLLPGYFQALGDSPAEYGYKLMIFMLGFAAGTFAGGLLGDIFSRRVVIFVSTIASIPFCYLMLGSDGWLFIVSALMAAFFLNMAHSILIIMAQALLPKNKGMMGGVVLGFMFASGAVMAWIAGLAADVWGLTEVMYALAFVPILAALSVFLLPRTRPKNTAASV